MNFTPFADLTLTDPIRRAVEDMGFTDATEIQAQSIPLIRSGRDMIGRSQTGTGKTLAFGIPAVEIVDTNIRQPQVLILCPTRELAMQCCAELRKLSRYRPGVKPEEIYGGVPMNRQIFALRSGANVIVGTPGRVMDHMRRGTLTLEEIKLVVLDEADEMLSMGFKEDIETILRDTPYERQTVLFSATMPPEIMAMTEEFQKDPALVEINKKQPSVKSIRQISYEVPATHKMEALNLLLHYHDPRLAIVFCNTKKATDELTSYLNSHGFDAEGLHGDMKQQQRTHVLSGFKSQRTSILVATDVAARGIDVENIDFVINFDLPQDPEYYIHRIGRTGRAGKSGTAISLCCGRRQQWQLKDLAKFAKSEIEAQTLPTAKEIEAGIRQRMLDTIENELVEKSDFPYADVSQKLLEKTASMEKEPKELVALLLEKASGGVPDLPNVPAPVKERERTSARTVKEPRKTREERRMQDAHMGYILLSVGKNQHVAPGNIVGAITQYTGISGNEIGRIDLYDEHSIVGVPLEKMAQILAKLESFKICGQKASAEPCGGPDTPKKKRGARYENMGQKQFDSRKNQQKGRRNDRSERFERAPRRHKSTGQSGKNRLH